MKYNELIYKFPKSALKIFYRLIELYNILNINYYSFYI